MESWVESGSLDIGVGRERSGKSSGLRRFAVNSIQIAGKSGPSDIFRNQANSSLYSQESEDFADSREFFGSLWVGGRDWDSIAATSSIICMRKNSSIANALEQELNFAEHPPHIEGFDDEERHLSMGTERLKVDPGNYRHALEQVCMEQVRDANSITLNFCRKFSSKQNVVKLILTEAAHYMGRSAREITTIFSQIFQDVEQWIRAVEAIALAFSSSGMKASGLREIITCVQHYQSGWKSFQEEAHRLLQICDSTCSALQDPKGHYSQLELMIEGFVSQYAGTFSSVCSSQAVRTRPRQSLFGDHFLLLLSMQIDDQLTRQEYQTLSISFDKIRFHLEAIKSLLDRILALLETTRCQASPNDRSNQPAQQVFSAPMVSQGKSLMAEIEKYTSKKDFESSCSEEVIDYLRRIYPKSDKISLNTVSNFFASALYRMKTKSPYMQACILCRSVGSGFPCLMVIDVDFSPHSGLQLPDFVATT